MYNNLQNWAINHQTNSTQKGRFSPGIDPTTFLLLGKRANRYGAMPRSKIRGKKVCNESFSQVVIC